MGSLPARTPVARPRAAIEALCAPLDRAAPVVVDGHREGLELPVENDEQRQYPRQSDGHGVPVSRDRVERLGRLKVGILG